MSSLLNFIHNPDCWEDIEIFERGLKDMEIEDKYLSAENCKDGDIVEFIDAGVPSEIKQKDNSIKKVYNFQVRVNNKEFTYTPQNKSLKIFIKAWGRNTDSWVGKKFSAKIVNIEVAGKEYAVIRPTILEVKA